MVTPSKHDAAWEPLEALLGRYELVQGTSNKFWECLRDGSNQWSYGARWGRIGTKTSERNIKLGMSGSEARSKIIEKMDKGYLFVEACSDIIQLRVAEETRNRLSAAVAPATETPEPEPPRSLRL